MKGISYPPFEKQMVVFENSAANRLLLQLEPDAMSNVVTVVGLLIIIILINAYSRATRGGGQSVSTGSDSFFRGLPYALPSVGWDQPTAEIYTLDSPLVRSAYEARTKPRVLSTTGPIPRSTTRPHPRPRSLEIHSGFDSVGEYVKLAIKVENLSNTSVSDVEVEIKLPDGFKLVRDTTTTQKIGAIQAGGFQSAIFWLKPLRCVDGEYSGTVHYRDSRGIPKRLDIPPKRLVNICPMLTATQRADEVFARLKNGDFARNCHSFEFNGDPQVVFHMAEARLTGLIPIDHSEQRYGDGVFLGYSCYVGQTKYGESQFAAEIQVSGTIKGGMLTVTIYSEDKRILSGFFVDIMYDIHQHIEIIEEKMCPIATCPKCGGPYDLSAVGPDRIYRCEYCGTMGKVAPWLIEPDAVIK